LLFALVAWCNPPQKAHQKQDVSGFKPWTDIAGVTVDFSAKRRRDGLEGEIDKSRRAARRGCSRVCSRAGHDQADGSGQNSTGWTVLEKANAQVRLRFPWSAATFRTRGTFRLLIRRSGFETLAAHFKSAGQRHSKRLDQQSGSGLGQTGDCGVPSSAEFRPKGIVVPLALGPNNCPKGRWAGMSRAALTRPAATASRPFLYRTCSRSLPWPILWLGSAVSAGALTCPPSPERPQPSRPRTS
jgi:hypothetical protein